MIGGLPTDDAVARLTAEIARLTTEIARLTTDRDRLAREVTDERARHARILDSIREAAIDQYHNGGSICGPGLAEFLENHGMAPLTSRYVVTYTVTFDVELSDSDGGDEDAAISQARSELNYMSRNADSGVTIEWSLDEVVAGSTDD